MEFANWVEAAGGRALFTRADVADAAAVARLSNAAETAFSGVDVLVNNSAIMKLAPLTAAMMRCSTARSR